MEGKLKASPAGYKKAWRRPAAQWEERGKKARRKGWLDDGDGMRGARVCVCAQINVDVLERGERQAG